LFTADGSSVTTIGTASTTYWSTAWFVVKSSVTVRAWNGDPTTRLRPTEVTVSPPTAI
jgi:hypothetical protein